MFQEACVAGAAFGVAAVRLGSFAPRACDGLLLATICCTRESASRSRSRKTSVLAMDRARGTSASTLPLASCTSTVTSIDRPISSGWRASSSGRSAMRTGTRCTILIQLPVAFCAGSSEKAEPVPAPRPSTWPWYLTLRPYTSAARVTGWPMRRPRSWLSLKLASTHTPPSGTTAISGVPGATFCPTCTPRLAT